MRAARVCYHAPMRRLILTAVVMTLLVPGPAPAGKAPAKAPSASKAEAHRAVPFIADDYPAAVALARAKKIPIFIEAWAPW